MITMKRMISVVLALVMIFALAAVVTAKSSPVAKDFYDISVSYNPADGSLGTASGDKDKVNISDPDDNGNVTLTAVKKGDGSFEKWVIDGDYDIISGSLTDSVIVIKPKTDIKATAKFAGATPDQKPTEKPNDSKTSPKTGDPLWIILGLAVLALGAGAIAVKKIKE